MVYSSRSRGGVVWLIATAVLATVTALALFGPWSNATWERPQLLFALVTAAAATTVIAATCVIALADRWDMAEIGLLGTVLLSASVMPMVHGLVTPGVLFDETAAFRTSSFLTIPIAVAVGSPLLASGTRFGRRMLQRWRDWTLLALTAVFVVASAILFVPDGVSTPGVRHPVTIAVTLAAAAAVVALALRQLRLFEMGRHPSNLVASISMSLLAVMALAPLAPERYGAAFWVTHVAGVLGVAGTCSALVLAKRIGTAGTEIFKPLLARDPLAAFELGLSPVVHEFIADLEAKDEVTRDHVIRTGELAIRVGERMRLPAAELRTLGLAAMLHDVGKLRVPDDILKKPASLTADEYAVMKHHTVDGEAMLRSAPALAEAADVVRSHHERVDGAGYPDGLRGDEIPIASRIIAVCDAVDAMTHDRPYRQALTLPLAFAILREHAGTQWDATVVEHAIAVVPGMASQSAFEAVGRMSADDVSIPDDIGELLAAVDAEI